MKHFFALSLFASLLSMAAQNPNYDPDSNGDDLIGAEDLVSLLGVYNTSLAVDTTLECDFDGTAEDEWLFGIFTGAVVIDSIVVQFSISDSATYYEPGCPTLQTYYLDVEMEYTMGFYDSDENEITFRSYYNSPWGNGGYSTMRFCSILIMGRHFGFGKTLNLLNCVVRALRSGRTSTSSMKPIPNTLAPMFPQAFQHSRFRKTVW